MIVDAQMKYMQHMENAASVVRQFSTCDLSRTICVMLDALMDAYKADLMRVAPEDLVKLQTAILQVQAIRGVVSAESKDPPKIL